MTSKPETTTDSCVTKGAGQTAPEDSQPEGEGGDDLATSTHGEEDHEYPSECCAVCARLEYIDGLVTNPRAEHAHNNLEKAIRNAQSALELKELVSGRSDFEQRLECAVQARVALSKAALGETPTFGRVINERDCLIPISSHVKHRDFENYLDSLNFTLEVLQRIEAANKLANKPDAALAALETKISEIEREVRFTKLSLVVDQLLTSGIPHKDMTEGILSMTGSDIDMAVRLIIAATESDSHCGQLLMCLPTGAKKQKALSLACLNDDVLAMIVATCQIPQAEGDPTFSKYQFALILAGTLRRLAKTLDLAPANFKWICRELLSKFDTP